MSLKNISVLGILTVIIGIFGVVGPIFWDYYKTRSKLDLTVIDYSLIIDKSTKLPGLEITYAGQRVDELSRITFSLVNTGRTPITSKDVVAPVSIRIPKSSGVLKQKLPQPSQRTLKPLLHLTKERIV